MSNILIIKHGSLGDIVQISGVLRDIRETHFDKKIFILTTMPYVELLSRCPYLDGVFIGAMGNIPSASDLSEARIFSTTRFPF